ncbi:DUF2911 domain-containing protein [Sediminicola luteus]|nr:DUF2911 domain-containing protein [Sediminicola luteus]
MPKRSPRVTETHTLGITKITLDYGSPALRGRDVWNDGTVPQKGEPYAWRAGADMNTTLSFDTDVTIEGQPLKAGTYGFHIIPDNDTYTLLFAHNNNQWGSYYLDVDQDVSLKVTVDPESCSGSEQLDFEFLNRTENTVTIGLEWGEKRIPFTVGVDLDQTVVTHLRQELRGINTYHWQAWDDAAKWCLEHDTNLEEALSWAERSIAGGYYGFAANKNPNNMLTKVRLLQKLNKKTEMDASLAELAQLPMTDSQANETTVFLLRQSFYDTAFVVANTALQQNPESWFLNLNRGLCHYFIGSKKKALKDLDKAAASVPDGFAKRMGEIRNEVASGTYKLPGA